MRYAKDVAFLGDELERKIAWIARASGEEQLEQHARTCAANLTIMDTSSKDLTRQSRKRLRAVRVQCVDVT